MSTALDLIIINTTFTCIDDAYIAIHSQKGISCSKSVAGLLPCHHQANIMMHSHHLLAFDDNNSSLLQVVNGLDINIIETFIHKLDILSCFNNLQPICTYQVAVYKSNFRKLVAT